MPEPIHLLKFAHVVGAALLLGGLLFSGLYLTLAHRRRSLEALAAAAAAALAIDAGVVLAAAVAQPVSGYLLTRYQERTADEPWMLVAYALFGAAALLWLAVTAARLGLVREARALAAAGDGWSGRLDRLHRRGLWLGAPATALLLGVFALMLMQPAIPGLSPPTP